MVQQPLTNNATKLITFWEGNNRYDGMMFVYALHVSSSTLWTNGSIPNNFTICSLTRYNGVIDEQQPTVVDALLYDDNYLLMWSCEE